MTDRPTILALAAEYNALKMGHRRAALVEAIAFYDADEVAGYGLPSGASVGPTQEARAVRLWVAASRRAAANPTRRKGPAVPAGRTRRISARVSDATEAALKGHAERTGRSVATVAGDVLEGWADNVNAPKGDEVDHD